MRIGLLSFVLFALPPAALAQEHDADVRTWMRLGHVDRGTATREVHETREVLLRAVRSRAPSSEPLGALRMVMFRRLEATRGVRSWNEQRRWFEDRLRTRLDAEALATTLGVQRGATDARALEWCVGTSIDLGLGWTVAHCERALAHATGLPVLVRETTTRDLETELIGRGIDSDRVLRISTALRAAMRALPHVRHSDPSARAVAVPLLQSCPEEASAVERVRAWEAASSAALACATSMLLRDLPREGAVLATSDVFGLDISDAETLLDHLARREAPSSTEAPRTSPPPARDHAAAIRRARPRLHVCADEAPYAGEVLFDATLVIDASGRVERVALRPSAGEPNEAMTACVSRVLSAVRFPEGVAEAVSMPVAIPRAE